MNNNPLILGALAGLYIMIGWLGRALGITGITQICGPNQRGPDCAPIEISAIEKAFQAVSHIPILGGIVSGLRAITSSLSSLFQIMTFQSSMPPIVVAFIFLPLSLYTLFVIIKIVRGNE